MFRTLHQVCEKYGSHIMWCTGKVACNSAPAMPMSQQIMLINVGLGSCQPYTMCIIIAQPCAWAILVPALVFFFFFFWAWAPPVCMCVPLGQGLYSIMQAHHTAHLCVLSMQHVAHAVSCMFVACGACVGVGGVAVACMLMYMMT